MPVVTASETAGLVHALLHDRPVAVLCENERVQVDLKAVAHRVVVDASGEAAGSHEGVAVETRAIRDLSKFVRRLTRLSAATAADINPELVRPRIQPALQRTHHRRRDPRR